MSEISTKVKWYIGIAIVFMPLCLIIAIVAYWPSAKTNDILESAKAQQEVRTAPIGQVALTDDSKTAEKSPDTKVAEKVDPKKIYDTVCSTCHASGLLGAPKHGDKAEWDKRLAEAGSFEGVVKIAITGKGSMPPKGGASISDEDFAQVVAYVSELAPVASDNAGNSSATAQPEPAVDEAEQTTTQADDNSKAPKEVTAPASETPDN